ncbi:hypothetical protein SAY87_004610 [Trapa incisa]|uniref:RING-type domain-containing protein n=1 Tax=Trapa incisa TaxID=236973 RepID=A0AAN7PMW0_9MYRT|nr:hypothetical protein SAY87_004610 [Trapa incisa]
MGLKSEGDRSSDDDGGGKSVPCSICLEVVTDNGDRSWAKLTCGHQFHLDCIGSAFNVKGAMQCPNCRKVERGQWLYANGCRSFPDFSMDEWTYDDDIYDIAYSEMAFGVQWCPFGQLSRFPSFEETDFSSAACKKKQISQSARNDFFLLFLVVEGEGVINVDMQMLMSPGSMSDFQNTLPHHLLSTPVHMLLI